MAFNKVFKFKEQLKTGLKGEDLFIKKYHNLNPRKSSFREVDIFINNNEKVELKSDQYPESKTGNFFIELVGNDVSGKLGGPHLSLKNGVDWFVYHYSNDNTFYWFNVKKLCKYIDENSLKYKVKKIKNYTYNSIGILIPRSDLEHLIVRKDKF